MGASNNPLHGLDRERVPSVLTGDSPAECARYFRICKQRAATAARLGDRKLAATWIGKAYDTGMSVTDPRFAIKIRAIYAKAASVVASELLP